MSEDRKTLLRQLREAASDQQKCIDAGGHKFVMVEIRESRFQPDKLVKVSKCNGCKTVVHEEYRNE